MARPRKPPRLTLRADRALAGHGGAARRVYVIRDGDAYIRTGCFEGDQAGAEQALALYLASKLRPPARGSSSAQVTIADVLLAYLRERAPLTARPRETEAAIHRLNEFWGVRRVDEVRGAACREFVLVRGTQSGARRDLETLRAAVNFYAREYGLPVVPRFAMPPRSPSRERWLTRSEAARLLRACRCNPRQRHLCRLILIGLYTGTRHRAILAMQWMPNTQGGWFDLEAGVMHRRGLRQSETKKRRPPARIPRRLLPHLRRWRRLDRGLRYVVRHQGGPILRVEKAFRGARAAAGLGDDVVIHTLRHTAATWLMQRGVDIWHAAGFLGMTVEQLQATYGHHHPDFQKEAANAL